ncbi:hypothetical protein H310_01522 [Aphanomyces invadans]|uniref:Uncharacterized protein n=1 Tax=Aphanomyces invadans TaxID=157072 RepID=A0A024UT17_9STRA|nr:hypothetical protein H310_01522 [Aphanomyces invadans]ETW09062.1 hypothetical protein H310_01522 [Aphanomyces invadans]|eukprot:XP_008862867.1 hypothetical protein H310_01522 [Aphanomyces invadans]
MEASKTSRHHALIKASLRALWGKMKVAAKAASVAARSSSFHSDYVAIEDRRFPLHDSGYLLVNDAA